MKILAALLLVLSPVYAKKLPTYGKYPWHKTYHGYHTKKFDVILDTEGVVKIYPLVDEKRVPESKAICVRVVVEFKENKAHKWVERRVNLKGFDFKKTAEVQTKEVSIKGEVTGKVGFELSLNHDKKGMVVKGSFPSKPDAKKGKYRLSIKTEFPDLYGVSANAKSSVIRSKTRGDSLLLEPIDEDEKSVRLKASQFLNSAKIEKLELSLVRLKAKRFGRRNIHVSLPEGDKGKLQLIPKNVSMGIHKGFFVKNVLVDELGVTKSKGVRVEIR